MSIDPVLSYSAFVDDRIERDKFLLDEVPSLHPASSRFREFWRAEKKKIIEGDWSNGVWMPGKLYFYVNYATIKRNIAGAKAKIPARPLLRDIEWMWHYNFAEARGFSGFELDPEFSCHEWLKDPSWTDDLMKDQCLDEKGNINELLYNNLFKADGTRKTYESPRYYLRKVHRDNYGTPLFFNEAKNIMMFGSRGFGKSYITGNTVLHEWLMDGALAYNDNTRKNPQSVEIIVGAEDAKYASDTLDKVKLSLDNLPGAYTYGNISFPSPLYKNYVGSWKSGYEIKASYRKKIGNRWVEKGSLSSLKNRTFKDNPFAAQGTRPGLLVFEEVGMFNNLIECYKATVENQRDGAYKFGTTVFIGTGGDFDGGGTRDAYEMFYNPQNYDILEFEDVWESKPRIGYFVPAYMGLNQFKNHNGFTNILSAKDYLERHRINLRNSEGSANALNSELQYRPIKPSEMFLAKTGNIFPVSELKERLFQLEANPYHNMLEKRVRLMFDANKPYGINYQIDTANELEAINSFPWDKDKSREGAVVIYEFPRWDKNGTIPKDLYIIGHDPYATDSLTGESLASTIVIKTKEYWVDHGHDEIVAVYVARPYAGREIVNENLLKLSMFYGNAKVYFENTVGNVKEYFEKVKRLDLLARRPQTVFTKKASFIGAPSNDFGYPMNSRQMKLDGIIYLRDWLLEVRDLGTAENKESEGRKIRNLDRIWDKALLQELIAFNLDGNFDRVMSLVGCVVGLNEMFNQYKNIVEQAGSGGIDVGDLTFIKDNAKFANMSID